jgi:drug/metabolite transporter (DMT)-like permease
MTQDRRSYVAEAALIGVAAVWGLTFPMVQDAVALIPVTTFLAYRFTIAGLLVGAVSISALRGLSTAALRAGLLMGACLTAGYLFQTFGLQRTSASNAGFITGLMVVLTPLFGAVLLGHRAGPIAWAAAAVSGGGLALLSGIGGSESNLAGDGLVFLCACSFAFHILATAAAVREHNVLALLVVQLGMCGIVCGAAAALMGDLQVPRGLTVWGALAITALVASALGFFVQTYAQRHAPPSRTALILASEPAFAGLFAYLLKGETLGPLQWLGAALILSAIIAVELIPHLRPSHPVPEA